MFRQPLEERLKNKTRFEKEFSKRVGFAGIRNRNRNRVSRPPAILRVFLNGSGFEFSQPKVVFG